MLLVSKQKKKQKKKKSTQYLTKVRNQELCIIHALRKLLNTSLKRSIRIIGIHAITICNLYDLIQNAQNHGLVPNQHSGLDYEHAWKLSQTHTLFFIPVSTNVEAMHQGDQKGLSNLVMLGQRLTLRKKWKGKVTLGQVIEAFITVQNKNKVMSQFFIFVFFYLLI